MATKADILRGFILDCIAEARRVAAEDAARLGRPLTDGEIAGIAEMVQRQALTAIAMQR